MEVPAPPEEPRPGGTRRDSIHRLTWALVVIGVLGLVAAVVVPIVVARIDSGRTEVTRTPLPSRVESPSPTSGPETSPTPSAGASPTQVPIAFEMAMDERAELDPSVGWDCVGDVVVNGQPYYDNDPDTGLVIVVPAGARVSLYAQWGASCHPTSPATEEDVRDELVDKALQEGCRSGCDDMQVVEFS